MAGDLARALVPPMASGLIRGLWSTLRVEWRGEDAIASLVARRRPFILAFWHCKLLLMQYVLRGHPVTALISQHGDGELIARTMARFGHAAVRGSSTRGGAQALRDAIVIAREGGSIAITPDGPKGPPRVAKHGVIEIARATGLPIVPASLSFSRVKRLASWDRFEVPLPFSRVIVSQGETLECPRDASESQRVATRVELERRLDALDREPAS